MLPQSILSEIMVYLTLPEILITSQVNKRFYSSSNIPSIYRREFISTWMSITDANEQASAN